MPYHIKPHMKKMTTFSFSPPYTPSSSSLLLLSLLAVAAVIHGATAAEDLIKKTCKALAKEDSNVQYGFCAASLKAAPASGCATLRGLGTITIRLIRYNVTDTRCRIKQLLKEKTELDKYTKMCLSDCLEVYSDSISDVKTALKEYNSGRLTDASVHLSAVLDAASTCEDGFEERRGLVSPLKKRNNDTIQLSAMALSLIHKLQTAGSKH